MEGKDSIIMNRDVVEFVTVSVEFCAFLEKFEKITRREMAGYMLKVLPLIYIKATLLPKIDAIGMGEVESFVKEDDYEAVRSYVSINFADLDTYLDVFVEDFKYSETPVMKTISEDIADIYQDVRDFVSNYRSGVEDIVVDALAQVKENFEMFWGQKLVNTMRAIHEVYYNESEE